MILGVSWGVLRVHGKTHFVLSGGGELLEATWTQSTSSRNWKEAWESGKLLLSKLLVDIPAHCYLKFMPSWEKNRVEKHKVAAQCLHSMKTYTEIGKCVSNLTQLLELNTVRTRDSLEHQRERL